jgi:hypothetical protein
MYTSVCPTILGSSDSFYSLQQLNKLSVVTAVTARNHATLESGEQQGEYRIEEYSLNTVHCPARMRDMDKKSQLFQMYANVKVHASNAVQQLNKTWVGRCHKTTSLESARVKTDVLAAAYECARSTLLSRFIERFLAELKILGVLLGRDFRG